MRSGLLRVAVAGVLAVALAVVGGVVGGTAPAFALTNGLGPDPVVAANIGTNFDSTIQAVLVQPDGKFLVGGNFTQLNGATANRLVRLNADGTRDAAFDANLGTGFDNSVLGVFQQADGKILVGGAFTAFNGVAS